MTSQKQSQICSYCGDAEVKRLCKQCGRMFCTACLKSHKPLGCLLNQMANKKAGDKPNTHQYVKVYIPLQLSPTLLTTRGRISLPKGCVGLLYAFATKTAARKCLGKTVSFVEGICTNTEDSQ